MVYIPICPIDSSRYGSSEVKRFFEESTRLKYLLRVEVAVAEAQAELGLIPKWAAEKIADAASRVSLNRVKEIESVIKHETMAIVKALAEQAGEAGRYCHLGLTSNDVLDTALALQVRDALKVVERKLWELTDVLAELTLKYKETVMVGRTHGQHAGVITFGLKTAVWLEEVLRHIKRFHSVLDRFLVGKILGVVGTGAALGSKALEVQRLALEKLGLKPAGAVTQIVQRDLHAELVFTLALIGCTLEKIALEIRNLQRPEIGEVYEPFGEKQVGSSAVPSKRNPITCEKICSLARLLRSLVNVAMENIALWHERDLTNSANERFTIPFSIILLDEMLKSTLKVLRGLEVYPERMLKNLELSKGLVMAERVMMKLFEKGLGRQEAHEEVRKASLKAVREGKPFKEALLENKVISQLLSEEEISSLLDPLTYLGSTMEIIDSVLSKYRALRG